MKESQRASSWKRGATGAAEATFAIKSCDFRAGAATDQAGGTRDSTQLCKQVNKTGQLAVFCRRQQSFADAVEHDTMK